VTSAKCAGCDAPVEVTAEGMDALETFSRKLERDGQAPIDMNACFSCADCRAKRSDAALKKSTERRGRVTEAVRYLKSANDNPIGEAMGYVTTGKGLPAWNVGDAVKAAHVGLGYVVDLLTSIREGRKTPGRAKPKAGDL
jgi:ferredoxin